MQSDSLIDPPKRIRRAFPPRRSPALMVAVTLLTLGASGIQRKSSETPHPVMIISGTLEADQTVISPKIPGKLLKVDVNEGQSVTAGELVAELDSKELLDQLRQAKLASVASDGWLGASDAGSRPLEVNLSGGPFTDSSSIAAAPSAPSNPRTTAKQKAAVDAGEGRVAFAEDAYHQAEAALKQLQAAPPKGDLDAASESYKEAKTTADKAQDHFQKWKQLFDDGAISARSLDSAKAARDETQATCDQANAKLKALQSGPNPDQLRTAQAALATAATNRDTAIKALADADATVAASAKSVPAPPKPAPKIAVTEVQAAQVPFGMLLQGSLRSTHASRLAAQKAVTFIQSLVDQTKIYAPTNGVVSKGTLLPGAQMAAGAPLLTLSSPDRVWITLRVPSDQASKLQPNQLVEVRPTQFAGQSLIAHVFAIEPISGIYSVMNVKVLIDNSALRLSPGMTASVMIRTP